MRVLQTPAFLKRLRQFNEKHHQLVRQVIDVVLRKPERGKPKGESLSQVRIYRQGLLNERCLLSLAYQYEADCLTLIAVNLQENQ